MAKIILIKTHTFKHNNTCFKKCLSKNLLSSCFGVFESTRRHGAVSCTTVEFPSFSAVCYHTLNYYHIARYCLQHMMLEFQFQRSNYCPQQHALLLVIPDKITRYKNQRVQIYAVGSFILLKRHKINMI